MTEKIVTWDGVPLRLVFCPDAIRQHFADDPRVLALSREKLLEIGASALDNGWLYDSFDTVLREAVLEHCGFTPKDEAEDGTNEDDATDGA